MTATAGCAAGAAGCALASWQLTLRPDREVSSCKFDFGGGSALKELQMELPPPALAHVHNELPVVPVICSTSKPRPRTVQIQQCQPENIAVNVGP